MTPEPIDAQTLHQHLAQYGVSLVAVQKTLKTVKHEEYYSIYRSVLKVELWDKASPINGVSSEHVLEHRHDVTPDHDVILVRDGSGKIMYFQPVLKSDDPQPMLDRYLHEMATAHANSAVTTVVTDLLVGSDRDGDTVEE